MEEKDLATNESSVDEGFHSFSDSSTIREFVTLTSQPVTTSLSSNPSSPLDPSRKTESATDPMSSFSKSITDPFPRISYYLRINGFDVPDPILPNNLLLRVKEEPELSQWCEKVLQAIVDQNHRIQKFQTYVFSLAEKDSQTRIGELLKVGELEKRLDKSKQKEESLQRKIQEYESASFNSSFHHHSPSSQVSGSHSSHPSSQQVKALQAKVKSLESLLKESERKQKQRETEFERLRSKLHSFVEKERSEQVKHSQVLKRLEGKEKLLVSLFSQAGFLSPSSADSSSPVKDKAMAEISQVFVAIEKHRQQLQQQNEELQLQLDKLTRSQLISERSSSSSHNTSHNTSHQKRREDPRVLTIPAITSNNNSNHNQNQEETEIEAELRLARESVEELQETIFQQQIDLDYQSKKLRLVALEREDETKRVLQLQQTLNSQQQAIENLEIELKARPTLSQWRQAQREIADLEKVTHNLKVARAEAEELTSWKSHLNTSERVKIDQRNHELHLWLVESLPRSYLREILQGVCRELDVSDVSEVIPNLQKLKTVVRTVPRMEELLANLSSYVFERNSQLSELLGLAPVNERDLTLDSVLAILRRWWMILQRCIELEDFRVKVTFELFRREQLLFHSNQNKSNPLAGNEDLITQKWKESQGLKVWIAKEQEEVLEGLGSAISFETQFMTAAVSSPDFEQYLRQRPDLVSNRILQYLQTLLEVSTVDQVMAASQQLFLQNQQFQQFLEISRKILGKPKDFPAEVVVSEVIEKLQLRQKSS